MEKRVKDLVTSKFVKVCAVVLPFIRDYNNFETAEKLSFPAGPRWENFVSNFIRGHL